MQDHDLFNLGLNCVVSVIGFFGVMTLKDIRCAIEETRRSVDDLNVKVATVIEKTSNHERRIDSHDDRILNLEATKKV